MIVVICLPEAYVSENWKIGESSREQGGCDAIRGIQRRVFGREIIVLVCVWDGFFICIDTAESMVDFCFFSNNRIILITLAE